MGDDLAASYAASFDGHLPFGERPALLLVDVCMAYLTPGAALHDPAFEAAIPVLERLVAAARAAAVPVLFTRVVYTAGGRDGGLFYRKLPVLSVFDAGSPLGDFPPSLRPGPDDVVVTKQYASSFFGTALASTLRGLGIDTLLVTGFSTSGCVRATALDALQHGFAPFVVRDACADRHSAPHEANLFDLQAKYAEVIDSETAVDLLGRTVTSSG
ncbi:isochorismatase family protein [Glacieibacterium frigidum]|uniref:Isochorismatase family protein n=1 Tax=Glacieibacterium frigidum TaxID=2593303 RepID=A0A552UAC3_9SPHN|nr:isochorismatase family protein [Glacieibacterium frigidum]TRW15158.1 isochorismatase family protein [Glacieibacterium frigidum]